MSDPKQEESSFKVVDRRLFKEDGEIRQEVVEQEKRDEEIAAKRAESAAREKTQGAKQSATTESASDAGQKGSSLTAGSSPAEAVFAPAGAADGGIPSSRSFQILVDFIARNAAAMLGGMADPRTGQPFLDLDGAHEMIDMLDVLREKTQGNLAKSDEDLLVEIIGGLKLTYVEISKAAADAMAQKAAVKK